jgi:hypothetical protein
MRLLLQLTVVGSACAGVEQRLPRLLDYPQPVGGERIVQGHLPLPVVEGRSRGQIDVVRRGIAPYTEDLVIVAHE